MSERLLHERARALAQAPPTESGTRIQVLIFRLGQERYAVELAHLQSVQTARGLTPVPCAPPSIAGVLNVRGEIVSVMDLAALLDLPRPDLPDEAAPPDDRRVLLASHPEGRIGLLVDDVLGIEGVAVDQLEASLSGEEFARGVMGGRTVLLDLAGLLTARQLEIVEDVS